MLENFVLVELPNLPAFVTNKNYPAMNGKHHGFIPLTTPGYTLLDVVQANDSVVAVAGSEVSLYTDYTITPAFTTKFSDNELMAPSHIFLHDACRKMLARTSQQENFLAQFDVETGANIAETVRTILKGVEVVQELKLGHEDIECKLTGFPCLSTKFASMQESGSVVELTAFSRNSIFKLNWDTRVPGEVIVKPEDAYTRKAKGFRWTCAATTKEGRL